MMLPMALALGTRLFLLPIADAVPHLNVEQVCTGIAKQGGTTFRDPAFAKEKKNCLKSEQAIRDQLVRQWSSFSAADRNHCAKESVMGGESSYTELLTCLEMARDVRALRAQQRSPAHGTSAPR